MTMFKKVLLSIALAVALFAGVGMFLPRTAHVERAIVIDAPQPAVFTILNGFRLFPRWSPWADIDPGAITQLDGPETGVGAKMSWAGNAEVGTGSQEILESVPYERLKLRLTFGDFPGDFTSSYSLAGEGSGTRVTWAFDADYGGSVLGRYFGLMSDAMLGPDYEKGLGRLKALAESLPGADFSRLQFEVTSVPARTLLLLGVRSAEDPAAIGVALGVAFGRLSGFASSQRLERTGPLVAIHHGVEDGAMRLDAALPVNRTDVALEPPIRAGQGYEGRVLKATYTGDPAGLAAARQQVLAYVAAARLESAGPLWEEFVSDPAETPPAQQVTHLYVPIR